MEIRISEDFRLPVEVMERIQDELKFCTGVLEVISHDWRVRESYEWHTLYLAVKSEYGSIHNFIVMDWDYIGLRQCVENLVFNNVHKADFNVFNNYLMRGV